MTDFPINFETGYRYFTYRMPDQRFQKRDAVQAKCPFHQDRSPSMSLQFAKGLWNCHTCGKGGGLLDFERTMFPSRSVEQAWGEIYRITGTEAPRVARKLTATYSYEDARGKILYEKLRYEPKDFRQRQPDGKGGYVYNLDGVKRVLYHLPQVVTARVVFICEGEKDADNLRTAMATLPERYGIATTTNFDGAAKWKDDYSPHFTGKAVVILPDNDEMGQKHAQVVAKSIAPFAAAVKVVNLPGLEAKGDVSDWLAAGHTALELWTLIGRTQLWTPAPVEHVLLEEVSDFLERTPQSVEWLVEGVLPKGANGVILASPKVGKSLVAIDLSLALVSGSSWLGFVVPQKRRVALISREDSPDETGRRILALKIGWPPRQDYIFGQFWVNTRFQSATFLLENANDVDQLIAELKKEQIDLAIFDVFRRVHNADENDNTEMSAVLASLNRIQSQTGASIAVIHHLTKEASDNIFRAARGAGAIHGWMEWGMGISICDETLPRSEWIRKAEFELKCGLPKDPVYYAITEEGEQLRMELKEKQETKKKDTRRRNVDIDDSPSWHDRGGS